MPSPRLVRALAGGSQVAAGGGAVRSLAQVGGAVALVFVFVFVFVFVSGTGMLVAAGP
ncbi:hypothetical protein ACMHYB_21650 [Sorangium sp. So ce1128]